MIGLGPDWPTALFYLFDTSLSLSLYSVSVIGRNTEMKNLGCSATETRLSWRLEAFFATREAFFSTCRLQTESLARCRTNTEARKGLDSKKTSIKRVETGEGDRQKERRRERAEWRGRQTGGSRGLLIRESLVTESFEMTADLRESIIRLHYATALLTPVPLGKGWEGGGAGCPISK